MAITHAFIPPTPGPIAVADIIGADLGWVILVGFLVGIPTALVSGLLFGKHIAKKIHVVAPPEVEVEQQTALPPIGLTMAIIVVPIFLILLNTIISNINLGPAYNALLNILALLGHPFSALLIANFLAWYFFGIKRGYSKEDLFKITSKSLAPAGTIILLTGAGGGFKQVLTDTGAGELLATSLSTIGFPVLAFAFVSAAIVRIVQGSSTVAMITAAGLVSPLLIATSLSPIQLACMVVAIASGASIFSHVNDSGFWLVGQYLGITEKETFKSWTMMATILAISGMLTVSIIYLLT